MDRIPPYFDHLHQFDVLLEDLISLLTLWVNTNSGSENASGLSQMCLLLKNSFRSLNAFTTEIELPSRRHLNSNGEFHEIPSCKALQFIKRPEAKYKILLGGHMDTVYDYAHPFQKAERMSPEILKGPGVADMKGGLLIMLKALEIFESLPISKNIGWEILITPDEEIGSPSSAWLYRAAAQRNNIGLLFEPSFSDGALVSERKGSLNYKVVFKGKAAHAGRDFHLGRSAINALADLTLGLENLNDKRHGITINVGKIGGGTATNIVADNAWCHFEVRMTNLEDMKIVKEKIDHLLIKVRQRDGIDLVVLGNDGRPPKPFSEPVRNLFNDLKNCAEDLGFNLQCRPSGGVCDGNFLVEAGLPTLDTLGAVGGNIHTVDEYIEIPKLLERIKLVSLFLLKTAEKLT